MGKVVRFVSRSLEDSVVNAELGRWGFWLGSQYAADGYSPMSTLSQILSYHGGADRSGIAGHKVLCVDPPARTKFWEINSRVLLLRRELYEALVAAYALPCKQDGQPYRATEKATFLGITPELFLDRLARGKRGYKSLIFPDLVLTKRVG
jgi:hypothetical protein